MKIANRTELRMMKLVRGFILDSFNMVVSTEAAGEVQKEYERRGYMVRTVYSYPKNYHH